MNFLFHPQHSIHNFCAFIHTLIFFQGLFPFGIDLYVPKNCAGQQNPGGKCAGDGRRPAGQQIPQPAIAPQCLGGEEQRRRSPVAGQPAVEHSEQRGPAIDGE